MVDINQAPPEQAPPEQTDNRGTEMAAGTELGLQVTAPTPGVQVVRVAGDVDLLTSPQLTDCVHRALARHPAHLIIDLAGVSHLGSTGLQVLVETRAAAATSHTQLWLTGTTAAVVRRPLEWTGLLLLFTCYDTVDQALAELR